MVFTASSIFKRAPPVGNTPKALKASQRPSWDHLVGPAMVFRLGEDSVKILMLQSFSTRITRIGYTCL